MEERWPAVGCVVVAMEELRLRQMRRRRSKSIKGSFRWLELGRLCGVYGIGYGDRNLIRDGGDVEDE